MFHHASAFRYWAVFQSGFLEHFRQLQRAIWFSAPRDARATSTPPRTPPPCAPSCSPPPTSAGAASPPYSGASCGRCAMEGGGPRAPTSPAAPP
eukprot:157011-Alexandrium_andersonii.AAC.1